MAASLFYFYTEIGWSISKICWIFVALYANGDISKMGKTLCFILLLFFLHQVCMPVTREWLKILKCF